MDNDFVTWVNSELAKHGWTQSELAKRSGVTSAAISKMLSRERMPGIDICRGIAKAFGMKDVEVARIAGLLDEDVQVADYNQTIRNTIRLMQDMDEKDQADVKRDHQTASPVDNWKI